MNKKPLIAGNWKMNLNHFEAIAHVQKIVFTLPTQYYDTVDITVLAPFTDLRSIQTLVNGDKLLISYGAQDVSPHDKGAYTGEISPEFLAKLGCTYVVIGHSERRQMYHETDELVRDKITAALRHQLMPIVCIGEDLFIREKGKHIEHCLAQLDGSFADLTDTQIAQCVIAYEPIWAIGTGKVASAEDAQEMCEQIRSWLMQRTNKDTAALLRILYGGSVTSDNIGELISQKDIDGALVGGASLKWEDFTKICAIAAGPANSVSILLG